MRRTEEKPLAHIVGAFPSGWRLAVTIAVVGSLLTVGGAAVVFWRVGPGHQVNAETVREYELEIVPKDIVYGDGAVWHAWTFNGTVPGPVLRVDVGETLRVRVINRHDMVHSFHAHLDGYSFEYDGSQANYLTGEGVDGMIPPGGEHTWEFRPSTPGIYYYHPHSANEEFTPAQVVGQGLYGAIIVRDPAEPPIREEVLFMGEIGFDREGTVSPFIMNGRGLPGGEVALERIIEEEGFAGVAKRFNKTITAFEADVNESFKLHVINIGNQTHSLYIHSANVVSLGVLGGRPWPARVLPLAPGAADTLLIKFENPGFWLFHCHVETHADAGQLGLFIIKDGADG